MPALPSPVRVSVVIPCFNEEAYIARCLQGFLDQDYPPDELEIIVADGGSTDSTRDLVRDIALRGRSVRLIDNPGRTTAHGLNAGAGEAYGDVIIIFGAHAIPGPGFVAANIDALRRTGAAAVGGPIETIGEGTIATAIAAALSHPFGVGDARFRFAQHPSYVDTVAFAAYRRECFEVVGGFDVTRDKAEDDYFNFAIRKAGGRLYLDPAIHSVYFGRSSLRSVARQYWSYGKAKGLTATDEPAALSPRHLVPAATVATGLALAAFALFGPRGRYALAAATLAYVALAAVAAWRSTQRRGRAWLTPLTAAVFPIVHGSYGLGTIVGLATGVQRRVAPRR